MADRNPGDIEPAIEIDPVMPIPYDDGEIETFDEPDDKPVEEVHMTQNDYDILTNIIGAVETGGQIYGQRRYSVYTPPYTNTKNEHTITLGWAGFYGGEARKLVQMIYDADPEAFKKIDSNSAIQAMLPKDWVSMKWNPSTVQKSVLIQLIDSETGHKMQDKLFQEEMKVYVTECEKTYTSNIPAIMMYCECRHLGGKSGADRIFKRCNGNYSLDSIMASLKKDQDDTSSSNQVGDKLFWSRHEKCREFIEKYVGTGGAQMATPKDRAKIFLRQTSLKTMTGYTPTASGFYKSAGAWATVPQKGYIVYFWGKPSGESNKRVCHVGIVEKVNTSDKTFGTIEGNTSSSTWTTNGGCVARHTYSYSSVGGQNRVHGFGIPDFKGADITADQYVAMAQKYVGYEEKKSNASLDDFHANKGSNNFTKFQRDAVGWTGDQWCQYFVDAMAIYCAGGETPNGGSSGGSSDGLLRKGSSGEAVKTMQTMLIALGYDLGSYGADGDFGSKTEEALKAFQKAHGGLEIDGVYGAKSKAALEEACKAILKHGSKGDAVKTMQEMLIYCGYSCGTYGADGDFGSSTLSALLTFQRENSLEASGYYDSKSKTKLEELYAKKKAEAESDSTVYDGVDYSPVYNYSYYRQKYEDLRKAYGTEKAKYFRHFCKYGMQEGRRGSASFDVQAYKNRYEDLRKAYGDYLPNYYRHYCKYGKKEGRKCT